MATFPRVVFPDNVFPVNVFPKESTGPPPPPPPPAHSGGPGSLPARMRVLASVASINGYICPIQRATTDAQLGSGNTQIVAAPASGSFIRVLSIALANGGSAAAANTFQFRSGASTAISPAYSLPASGKLNLPFNEGGWMVCADAAALNLNVGSAQGANQITQLQIDYIVTPTEP